MTVKIKTKNEKGSLIEFDGGAVRSTISERRGTFSVTYSRVKNVRKETLTDFAEAMQATLKHVGRILKHGVKMAGTKVDPDEKQSPPGADFQIFPKDKRYHLIFTMDLETGYVTASLPSLTLTDIPSGAQVVAVCIQAAVLMRAYERANSV